MGRVMKAAAATMKIELVTEVAGLSKYYLKMFRSVAVLAIVASASAFAPSVRPFGTFGTSTAVFADPEWAPADGYKWEEKDFESEIKKLESEAEDRLDAKIKELEGNVATVGQN